MQQILGDTKSSTAEILNTEIAKRPEVLHGQTIQVESPHGTVYTTINEDANRLPMEVFVTVGKVGSDVAADAEGLGRALSLILRIPSEMGVLRRLQVISKHLTGIGGSKGVGLGSKRVRSIPDAISRAIQEYLAQRIPADILSFTGALKQSAEGESACGNLCIECGIPTVKQEGCEKCPGCGWSSC